MKNKNFVLELYRKKQSVFSTKEISLLFPDISYPNLKRKISYYVKTGKILRLRKGIYGKKDYNHLELANKIYTPSYISFETALKKEGVIFQESSATFVASYLTRRIQCVGLDIFYRKIKNEVLVNLRGLERKEGYFIASKERAFLDAVFVYKDYHFDNLSVLNWDTVFDLLKIYKSKVLEKRVNQYFKIYKEENVE